MKNVIFNNGIKKKLELKKTAIANLQLSDKQMMMIVGGSARDCASKGNNGLKNDCTVKTHTR